MKAGLLTLLLCACGPPSNYYYGEVEYTGVREFRVIFNDHLIDIPAMDSTIDWTLLRWEDVVGSCARVTKWWIVWMDLPFTVPELSYPLAGVTYPDRRASLIGTLANVANTALGHELGHVVLFKCGMDYSEDALRVIASSNNLPY